MTASFQYSPQTLADQLRGELEGDYNASGGTIPDRVLVLVKAAGAELWNAADWQHRRKRGTLTTAEGVGSVDCPADMAELDQRWLQQKGKTPGQLRFTTDHTDYQHILDRYLDDASGQGGPIVACIARKLVDGEGDPVTTFSWQWLLAPVPDAAYSFDFWYLLSDPWTTGELATDDAIPVWPVTFFEGWRLLAKSKAMEAFGRDAAKVETAKSLADRWLAAQIRENMEVYARDVANIPDGYDDFRGLFDQPFVHSTGGVIFQ